MMELVAILSLVRFPRPNLGFLVALFANAPARVDPLSPLGAVNAWYQTLGLLVQSLARNTVTTRHAFYLLCES